MTPNSDCPIRVDWRPFLKIAQRLNAGEMRKPASSSPGGAEDSFVPRWRDSMDQGDVVVPALKRWAIVEERRCEGKAPQHGGEEPRFGSQFLPWRERLRVVAAGPRHMRTLEKTARFGAIGLAGIFIVLSLGGIFGAWFVSRKASDVALKMFGVIEIGVGMAEAGVGRVDDLIATSRTEVRQAAETISAVGGQTVANSAVLTALNERLETNLAPRIAQMQQALAPVRDALGKVSNAVSMVSALPGMAERAPRLAVLDEALNRIEGMSADATQLRNTLKGLTTAQAGGVTAETVATLNSLTQRIDTRLGEVQTNVRAVRAEVKALQERLEKRKSRLLFVFNLTALFSTLMLAWVVYTQVIVIRHQREKLKS